MECDNNLIDYMPDELMLSIFNFLPPKDLGTLSGVSKKIKTLAEDDQLWKQRAKRDYPDSSIEFEQREIVELTQEKTKKRRKLSPTPWKALYRQRTFFYSAACNNTLTSQSLVTGSSISCLAVFQNTVYAGGQDKKIFACTPASEVIEYENRHQNTITCIKVEKNKEGSTLIYTGSIDSVLKIWNESFQLLAELTGHDRTIFEIETNEQYIFSASQDKTIRIWDKTTYQHFGTLEDLPAGFRSMTYGADRIVAGTVDSSIGIWDGSSFKFLNILKTDGVVYQVRIWENKIYCADHQNVKIFDLTTYELIKKIDHFKNSRCFDIYDGRFFYCADLCSSIGIKIEIYNAETFECESKKPIPTASSQINSIRVFSKGIFYAAGMGNHGIHHYPTPSLSD